MDKMKRPQKWVSFWEVVLVLGLPCHGQSLAGESPPLTISGTVRDPSGASAAGVVVTFRPGHYMMAHDYAEAMTDKDGRYALTVKPAKHGPFILWSGPVDHTESVLARDLKKNLAAIHEFIEMPTNIDLTLQPGITLSGFVKDTNGSPVATGLVGLCIRSGRMFTPLEPQPIRTDAHGFFSIPALPQGRDYGFVWGLVGGITAPGYGSASAYLGTNDSHTNHYEFPAFVLRKADRKFAGQVLDHDRKPVAGANVWFMGQDQPQMDNFTQTDGQGRFAFDGLCDGRLKIFTIFSNGPDSREVSYVRGGDGMEVQGGETNVVLMLGGTKPD
jgi:hypothetical protein